MSTAARSFRDCLGRFASGVTVVTVRSGEAVHGATVSSFTSVSLEPPLVMVSLDRRSRMCAALDGAGFGINILAAGQQDLALHFAGRPAQPAAPVLWEPSDGAPRLAGAAAYLDCTSWAAYDGGDHVLYVGAVRSFDSDDREPLVFHGGAFRALDRSPKESAWTGSLDGPADGAWAPGVTALLTSLGH
ncbi:flavin reductase family protein [Streptomyces sp. LHD-70]|uniref:flavin reductase family protein n=1 Tax=Streptomyces sp. LHD-70 TaxID=3072140 RepID=UPI00281028A8|nr:flavin reductase family protein [Streptomyces sp. LHD-70]MDQ8706899.1 flavin reductase family protein [Streptomyces sp. LHD-70]